MSKTKQKTIDLGTYQESDFPSVEAMATQIQEDAKKNLNPILVREAWEKEFEENFYHEENIDGEPCEFLVNKTNGKCDCQIGEIKAFISAQRQQAAEEATRKERDRCLRCVEDVWVDIVRLEDFQLSTPQSVKHQVQRLISKMAALIRGKIDSKTIVEEDLLKQVVDIHIRDKIKKG